MRRQMPFWQQILIALILWTLCAAKIAQIALFTDSQSLSDFLLLAAWLIIAFDWTRRIVRGIREQKGYAKSADGEETP